MSRIDDLAEVLFNKFQKKLPLPNNKVSGKVSKPPSRQLIEQRLSEFYAEAGAVRKEHALGVIGWARVVKALQQRLLRAGQPPELVKPLLFTMLLASRKSD